MNRTFLNYICHTVLEVRSWDNKYLVLVYYHEKCYISLDESGHFLLLLAICIEKIEQGRAGQGREGREVCEGQGRTGKKKKDLGVKLEYHKTWLYASYK